MNSLPRLAVVEDDPEFREGVLLPVLKQSGFDVVGLGSALELYKLILAEHFDLVLLDVGLPDEDGITIAAHLRSRSPTLGIVMLTAHGGGNDRMDGLQAGADAYLCKPANMKEVVATLLNLSRRISVSADAPEAQPAWRLDRGGWWILSPRAVEVALNPAERLLMARLAEAPGFPVTREDLIARLSDQIFGFDSHRLDLLVYRLRKKCLKSTGQELPLKVVRGAGYVLGW